jgi:hypothetical protein
VYFCELERLTVSCSVSAVNATVRLCYYRYWILPYVKSLNNLSNTLHVSRSATTSKAIITPHQPCSKDSIHSMCMKYSNRNSTISWRDLCDRRIPYHHYLRCRTGEKMMNENTGGEVLRPVRGVDKVRLFETTSVLLDSRLHTPTSNERCTSINFLPPFRVLGGSANWMMRQTNSASSLGLHRRSPNFITPQTTSLKKSK